MKIAKVETRHCDAGWRNYHFVKVTTESGIVGWSEFDEGFVDGAARGVCGIFLVWWLVTGQHVGFGGV